MKALLSVAVVWLLLNAALLAQDSDVSGRVTDSQGQPQADVVVFGNHHFDGGGYKAVRSKTDADGHYNLVSVGQFLFFRKAGYHPFTCKRAADATANATLMAGEDGWRIPACTKKQKQERRYGDTLVFLAPASAKARKGEPDTDNWKIFLSFPGSRKEKMTIWSGPSLGGGAGYTAPDDWYVAASTISERGGNKTGNIDIRGTLPDGRHWRTVSWITDIAMYYDVSDAGAKYFDDIIDTGCLSVP